MEHGDESSRSPVPLGKSSCSHDRQVTGRSDRELSGNSVVEEVRGQQLVGVGPFSTMLGLGIELTTLGLEANTFTPVPLHCSPTTSLFETVSYWPLIRIGWLTGKLQGSTCSLLPR